MFRNSAVGIGLGGNLGSGFAGQLFLPPVVSHFFAIIRLYMELHQYAREPTATNHCLCSYYDAS
jgi:hypothetical protein